MRVWTFVTLLLGGLGLLLQAAYTIEIVPQVSPTDVGAVGNVYQRFGWLSTAVLVAGVFAAIGLSVMARGHAVHHLVYLGTIALGASMAIWAVWVAPQYATWFEAVRTTPQALPEVFATLRARWVSGQIFSLVLWMVGFVVLLFATVRADLPDAEGRPAEHAL
jgi:hypothetical protein